MERHRYIEFRKPSDRDQFFLVGGTHITVAGGIIDCTLVAGDHIEIADEAINCTLVGGDHIEINDEDIDCTLVGGEHITIAGEDINHDDVGLQDNEVEDDVNIDLGSGWTVTLRVTVLLDKKHHVTGVDLSQISA